MSFDLEGKRLRELMHNKDLRALDPGNPTWRIDAPTLAKWLLGGFRAPSYDLRLTEVVGAVLQSWPGSYVTYSEAPTGLRGAWKAAELGEPDWKESETGAFVRALDKRAQAWSVPSDADPGEMLRWLHKGGWSLWRPTKKNSGIPRCLAQGTFKTVKELGYAYLVSSSWENQFTEISIHPELALAAAA
jgi:hypothetical protein